MKLLVDHNLSPAIPRSLQHLYPSHEFVALSDKFPADTTDIDWMAVLDREGGWAVLTKDLRIQFRPHERLALDRSKMVFFFLAGAWRKYAVPETAARLIRLVPLMVKQVEIADRGRFELPINAGSKLRPIAIRSNSMPFGVLIQRTKVSASRRRIAMKSLKVRSLPPRSLLISSQGRHRHQNSQGQPAENA